MLFTILIFDFPKFLLLIFFGKIWSHNLEYFKLIEIWLRGRLLYAYFDFNIFFLNIFFIHIFWDNSSQNLKFFKLTEIGKNL